MIPPVTPQIMGESLPHSPLAGAGPGTAPRRRVRIEWLPLSVRFSRGA